MGLVGKIEKSSIIDILTVLVLGYNGYIIYGSLGYGQSIFEPAADRTVLALQLTGVLILVYALEFLHDRVRGGGDSHGLSH